MDTLQMTKNIEQQGPDIRLDFKDIVPQLDWKCVGENTANLFLVILFNPIGRILSPVGNDCRTKHYLKLQNYETCFLLRVIKLPNTRSSDMRLDELRAWSN